VVVGNVAHQLLDRLRALRQPLLGQTSTARRAHNPVDCIYTSSSRHSKSKKPSDWMVFVLLASCTDLDIGVKQFDKLEFVELFVLSKLILFKIKWFCIEFFNKKLIDVKSRFTV